MILGTHYHFISITGLLKIKDELEKGSPNHSKQVIVIISMFDHGWTWGESLSTI